MPTILESIKTQLIFSKLGKLLKLKRPSLHISKVIYHSVEYPIKNACWTRDGLTIEFHSSEPVEQLLKVQELTVVHDVCETVMHNICEGDNVNYT